MVSKKELREQIEGLKFDLRASNQALDRARARDLHRVTASLTASLTAKKEDALLSLNLIPEKFRVEVAPGGTARERIDWRAVDQAVEDLAAYRAAERGREIAGD